MKILNKLSFFGVPNTSGALKSAGSKIFFEIYRVGENFTHDLLYTNKENKDQVRFRYCEEGIVDFKVDNLELYGNIMI